MIYTGTVARLARAARTASIAALLLWVLVLSIAMPARAAQAPGVTIARTPSWVRPARAVPSGTPSRGGIALELFDEQTRFVGGQRTYFIRAALRIDNALGASDAGQRRFEFTPPYEHLVLHRLEVRRNGKVLPRLSLGAVQVLQREVRLDQNVESGARTAVVVVPDVRVGDVVYYEYSVVGQNPVLGGHAMDSWLLRLTSAVGDLEFRELSDHQLHVLAAAGALEPREQRVGRLFEYSLSQKHVPALQTEKNVPYDYDAAPWVQLTDFDSWKDVALWGAHLFHLPAHPTAPIAKAASEMVAGATEPAEQVRRVIRAVQERIRYVSLAFGQSSARPARPEQVLARRFGDCKDKALLSVALLRALGFEADVALVFTDSGNELRKMLPTSNAFDHAVVRVEVDGLQYFLDPTRLYQRGSLVDMAINDAQVALVLGENQIALTTIPTRVPNRPDVTVREKLDFKSYGAPVTLDIESTYRHGRAEALRAEHADSPADFDKAAKASVLADYPNATRVGKVEYSDDESANVIRIGQRYRLGKVWRTTPRSRTVLNVMPVGFMRRVTPAEPDRKSPLAVEYPLHVVYDISVGREKITVNDQPLDITKGGVRFVFTPESDATGLHLHYELATTRPRVDREALPAYRSELEKMRSTTTIAVFNVSTKAAEHLLHLLSIAAVVWALLVLAALAIFHRKQPWLRRPRVPWRPELGQRRGWLALLGLNVTLGPIRWAFRTANNFGNRQRHGAALMMSAGSSHFHRGFGALWALELMANVTFTLLFVYVAYLYWAKRRSFPLAFVATSLAYVVFIIADAVSGELILGPHSHVKQVVVVVLLLCWITYALDSRRVKATFLPDPEEERPPRRKRRRRKRGRFAAPAGSAAEPPAL